MFLIIIIVVMILMVYYIIYHRTLHSGEFFIQGNNNQKIDKLMIVAHPDDELIFGGSELVKESGWKVVCVTNATWRSHNIFSPNLKKNRYQEFILVMNKLGHAYEIWDFEDNLFSANWNLNLLEKKLLQIINQQKYNKIVTHNLKGEYGHVQHKKISEIINNIKPANLYVFGYNENIYNEYTAQITQLLKIYHSQNNTIAMHYKWIVHQCLEKISS